MRESTAFLNTIPIFLRRPRERAPIKLVVPGPAGARPGPRALAPRAETAIHGGVAPVRPDFLADAATESAAPEAEVRPTLQPVAQPQAMPAMPQAPGRRSAPTAGSSEPPPAPRRAGLPWLGQKSPPAAPERGDVVELVAHREAAENAPRRLQDELRAGFAAATEDSGGDDIAFQVTLPLAVIRQIRLLAAQDRTTHRAVVLRALRAAGLDVPDGADVDRRVAAAKRRQQA